MLSFPKKNFRIKLDSNSDCASPKTLSVYSHNGGQAVDKIEAALNNFGDKFIQKMSELESKMSGADRKAPFSKPLNPLSNPVSKRFSSESSEKENEDYENFRQYQQFLKFQKMANSFKEDPRLQKETEYVAQNLKPPGQLTKDKKKCSIIPLNKTASEEHPSNSGDVHYDATQARRASFSHSIENEIHSHNLLEDEHQREPRGKKNYEFLDYNEGRRAVSSDLFKMEERFDLIEVEIPPCTSTDPEIRRQDNQIWLGVAFKKILSISFRFLLQGTLNSEAAKLYCSQNLIYNIVKLIRFRKLSADEIEHINEFLKRQLFPYFELKYPQSENAKAIIRLSKEVIQVNNFHTNANELVHNSNVQFQFNNEGEYRKEIMNVLNYIIRLPNTIVKVTKKENKKAEDVEAEEEQSNARKADQTEDQKEEQTTLYTLFENEMEKLFKSVQKEDQIARMKQGLSPQAYYSSLDYSNKDSSRTAPNKKSAYKAKVREYTKYLIGRKIPEETLEYTEQEIKEDNLQIKNPQILRILNKICESLAQKFDNLKDHIIEREEPFRMKDGSQGYLAKTHRLLLEKLLNYEKGQIALYLKEVTKNNHSFQQMQAMTDVPPHLKVFTEEESMVGIFAAATFHNFQNYILGYLNKLIHGLLNASTKFEKIIKIESFNSAATKKIRKAIDKFYNGIHSYQEFMAKLDMITEEKPKKKKQTVNEKQRAQLAEEVIETTMDNAVNLGEKKEKTDKKADKNENDKRSNQFNKILKKPINELVPQLVSFRLGDIMRCKFQSKQSQVTAIFREVNRISRDEPHKMKILRIKNRLETGNKDIMINLVFRESVVVEMQLKVDDSKLNFITCSNLFNHYIYELERSKFGPVSELCSIWVNKDHRGKFFEMEFDKMNKKKKKSNPKHECQGALQLITLPIKCTFCDVIYNSIFCVENNFSCKSCTQNICGFCYLEMDNSYILSSFEGSLNILKEEIKIIDDEPESAKLPNYGACIKLDRSDAFVNKFLKIVYDQVTYLFEELPGDQLIQKENGENKKEANNLKTTEAKQEVPPKYNLLYEFKDDKDIVRFFETHAVISLTQQKAMSWEETNEIAKKYFIPTQFAQIRRQEKASVREEKKSITDNLLRMIKPCPSVTKLNLSENKLTDLKLIIQNFENVNIAVLASNSFDDIPNQINQLKNIEFLDLSKNLLTKINTNIVELNNLTELNLTNNKISEFPKELKGLEKLEDLGLGFNKLTKFPVLPTKTLKFLDIQHNKIEGEISLKKFKVLEMLNLSFNQITKIKEMECPEIKSIELAYNKIPSIHFKDLYKLENLNMSNGRCSEIEITFQDVSKSSIKTINLSSNKFKRFSNTLFENICKAEQLNISSNYIKSIPTGIYKMIQLEELNASGIRQNFILQVEGQDKEAPEAVSDDDDDDDEEILPQNSHMFLKSLNMIDLSRNKLKRIPETIYKMMHLNELDASENQIYDITDYLGLDRLNLSRNKFTEFTALHAQRLNHLSELNLKHNDIDISHEQVKNLFKTGVELIFKDIEKGSSSSIGSKNQSCTHVSSSKSIKENIAKGQKDVKKQKLEIVDHPKGLGRKLKSGQKARRDWEQGINEIEEEPEN